MSIRNGGGNSNTTQLTIYLPSYDSMNLHVAETSNFNEILMAILEAHQSEKLHPPLYYHAPDFYVIRMHEGKQRALKRFCPESAVPVQRRPARFL